VFIFVAKDIQLRSRYGSSNQGWKFAARHHHRLFVVLASIFDDFLPLTAIISIALALLDDVPLMTIAFDNAAVPPQSWMGSEGFSIPLSVNDSHAKRCELSQTTEDYA